MPAWPADPPPNRWTAVTQYFSQDAILVNERGERFFDESVSLSDEISPIEIVQQPNARAFLLFDERIYRGDDLPGRSQARVGPNFDNAVQAGGPNVLAKTLAELIDGVAAWGVSRDGMTATIDEFNAAVGAGRGADLRIRRRRLAVRARRAAVPRAGRPTGCHVHPRRHRRRSRIPCPEP